MPNFTYNGTSSKYDQFKVAKLVTSNRYARLFDQRILFLSSYFELELVPNDTFGTNDNLKNMHKEFSFFLL